MTPAFTVGQLPLVIAEMLSQKGASHRSDNYCTRTSKRDGGCSFLLRIVLVFNRQLSNIRRHHWVLKRLRMVVAARRSAAQEFFAKAVCSSKNIWRERIVAVRWNTAQEFLAKRVRTLMPPAFIVGNRWAAALAERLPALCHRNSVALRHQIFSTEQLTPMIGWRGLPRQ